MEELPYTDNDERADSWGALQTLRHEVLPVRELNLTSDNQNNQDVRSGPSDGS
jgi:hypothetical protein